MRLLCPNSEVFGDKVYKVELADCSNSTLEWSVARHLTGLSVNFAHNLLVVSQGDHKLQEFTTRGTLIRETLLPRKIQRPWQAVELPGGQFLI